ncbi:MBL fold metallo-hydrolase [Paenibacillus sp. sgz500958]|uniref:MBL fold metallo-hydrolase n=1 Tax=Paenibacillus sp. sgz500958 TaxID=3242475 RepID=UPI0036D3BBFC
MRIKWYGHSSFYITSELGTTILIDPYGRKFLGYHMPEVSANIVAVTHEHRDHNQVHIVKGDYELLNQAGSFCVKEIEIKGIPTFHDNVGGAKKGNNLVFVFTIDGLTLCHCGDLGHLLTPEQLNEIGDVDVLMLPIGGGRTLGGVQAAEVRNQLRPAIVIPMHYRTKALGIAGRFFFENEHGFIKATGLPRLEVEELVVTRESLPDSAKVVTLNYQ